MENNNIEPTTETIMPDMLTELLQGMENLSQPVQKSKFNRKHFFQYFYFFNMSKHGNLNFF